MKVLIIEDEMPAARRLSMLVQQINPDVEVLDIIDSVEASVKWLNNHQAPELIFMDIQLADGLSFEIFEHLEIRSPIIFTTAYDEYTLRAFKVNSIDYLLKPIDLEELKKSIDKLSKLKESFNAEVSTDIEQLLKSLQWNKKEYKTRFLVKVGDRLISLTEDTIAYFYAEQKIVLLITNEGKKYAVDYSLDELNDLLDPGFFFRLNRQYLVRIQSIQSIHNYFKGKLKITLEPATDQETLVSRERNPFFKRWLDR